jgi:NAD(P)-dependent dehydrogenase (short-subunit alcohol dehydrogenase family)
MSDPWRLDGQVALVTGAGRGLGRGCALELARAGAHVVLVSRTGTELEQVAAEIGAFTHEAGEGAPAGASAASVGAASAGAASASAESASAAATTIVADVSEEGAIEQVVAEAAAVGELSVLVTAAGTNRPGPARDYALSDWDLLFDLNVRATFLACRAFGRNLLDRGASGAIVTMSSQMGSVGYPGRVAYCASKHAVDGMTKALAVEWARDGIRVNAVAPTFVDTPLTRPMLADPAFREEILERRLPTGRLAQVEDVARAVRYLACPASANVTGHVLKVDGGWTAW